MRKLLCIDSKTRLISRYQDRKRVDRARLPAPELVNWQTLAELEDFRANGRIQMEPQTA